MGSVKVDNEEIWNEYILSGKCRGFSIEGFFADKMEQPKKSDLSIEDQILGKIKNILTDEAK